MYVHCQEPLAVAPSEVALLEARRVTTWVGEPTHCMRDLALHSPFVVAEHLDDKAGMPASLVKALSVPPQPDEAGLEHGLDCSTRCCGAALHLLASAAGRYPDLGAQTRESRRSASSMPLARRESTPSPTQQHRCWIRPERGSPVVQWSPLPSCDISPCLSALAPGPC
jgi:hypothetical protein